MKYNYDLEKITPTKNNTGSSWITLDEYQQLFIQEIANTTIKVLEIGAGYGYLTSKLLEEGYEVTCSDIEKKHLDVVVNSVENIFKNKLEIICSPAQNLIFSNNSFDAVACCLVIHFLKDKEIKKLLDNISNWLTKGGVACITCVTPYFGACKSFLPIYEANRTLGMEFPGNINRMNDFLSDSSDEAVAPLNLNVIDLPELNSIIQSYGFKIIKSGYIQNKYYPDDLKNNGKECVGVLFKK